MSVQIADVVRSRSEERRKQTLGRVQPWGQSEVKVVVSAVLFKYMYVKHLTISHRRLTRIRSCAEPGLRKVFHWVCSPLGIVNRFRSYASSKAKPRPLSVLYSRGRLSLQILFGLIENA